MYWYFRTDNALGYARPSWARGETLVDKPRMCRKALKCSSLKWQDSLVSWLLHLFQLPCHSSVLQGDSPIHKVDIICHLQL